MALPVFRDEPHTDFTQEHNRQTMLAALGQIGRDLGREFPLIIGV